MHEFIESIDGNKACNFVFAAACANLMNSVVDAL